MRTIGGCRGLTKQVRVAYGTLPGVAVGLTVGVSRKIAPVYALNSAFAVREDTIQMTQR